MGMVPEAVIGLGVAVLIVIKGNVGQARVGLMQYPIFTS